MYVLFSINVWAPPAINENGTLSLMTMVETGPALPIINDNENGDDGMEATIYFLLLSP